ncbi:hypothetical protein FQA39_LY16213 [Lamprigera yunnana]|nr:hypothetical protein FQA39_LY16213 [Lamprigera yunnana]
MLPLIYEHKLKRCAANFCIGPFGGVQTRDFICIQSLDGLLIFFEQESFAFCCFLPQFLLPGPLIYILKSDSFITSTSSWFLKNFRYKNLYEAGHNTHEDDCSGTAVKESWSYNVGEEVIDIQYTMDINNKSYIIAFGERNLYCLSEYGVIRFIKKLDYTPTCMCIYTLNDVESTIWSVIVSETNTILIYSNTSLKWATQLSIRPVAIKRAFFKNINGVLVLLTEDGRLNCNYLGTEPHLFSTPPLAHQELNYEKAEKELFSLTKIIRNYYSSDTKLINNTAEKELQISVNTNPNLITEMPDAYKTCVVSVCLMPNVILEEMQVTATVYNPLKCTKEVGFYKNVTQKIVFETKVYIAESLPCPNLTVDIVVSYVSNLGVPKVIRRTVTLPLKIFASYGGDIKDSKYKITLDVDENIVPLSQLLPELLHQSPSTANEIGLKSNTAFEFDASIEMHHNQYQIQSNSLLVLNILINDTILKLKKNNCSVLYNGPLPTSELIAYIRRHFEKLQTVNELQLNLNQLSGQFRVIQKRLISKFKDKNPTSLTNMEILLEQTYLKIVDLGTRLETEILCLSNIQGELSCVLHLMLLLMNLTNGNKNLIPILETTFCSLIYDIEGQNWEDVLETGLCYLLRTILSQSENEKIKMTTFEKVTNLKKLELHITEILGRMKESNIILEETKSIEHANNEEQSSVGRFGESSSKIVSEKRKILEARNEEVEGSNMHNL